MFASLGEGARSLPAGEALLPATHRCSLARGYRIFRSVLGFASKFFSRRMSQVSKDFSTASANLTRFEQNILGSTYMCSSAGRLERASASGKEVRWISAGTAVIEEEVSTLAFEPSFLGFCRSKSLGNHCSDCCSPSRQSDSSALHPRSRPGDSVLFQTIPLALVLSG